MSRIGKQLIDGLTEVADSLEEVLRRGYQIDDKHGGFRVMTMCDGYVMARRKGCVPFVVSISEWLKLAMAAKKAKSP